MICAKDRKSIGDESNTHTNIEAGSAASGNAGVISPITFQAAGPALFQEKSAMTYQEYIDRDQDAVQIGGRCHA